MEWAACTRGRVSGSKGAKTMIQQTSLEAFETAKVSKGKRYMQICEALAIHGHLSNKEISDLTGLAINQVTPRVLELRQKGIIKDMGMKENEIGLFVHVWGV